MIIDRKEQKKDVLWGGIKHHEETEVSYSMTVTPRELELILKLLDKEFDGSPDYRLIESLTTTIRGSVKESDGIKTYAWAELHPDRV